ncbi:Dot/Icm T4SS effector AnkF/LegA14/Ceg31 [Legionella birminghamensis]|nr:Dot/Icm T4SS effector AnkF/LegA14/Ceg31 [Legionella birminghamensis]
MKDKLLKLFKKYPFIHFDSLGLSIIIPLTGASKVSDNFTGDKNAPVSLYLFGDNTCKSDLERRAFFDGPFDEVTKTFDSRHSFEYLFNDLIKELIQLGADQTQASDKQFIEALMFNLFKAKEKALDCKLRSPGYDTMRRDLLSGDHSIMVSKAEFIVKTVPDKIRNLDIPNIIDITSPAASVLDKIIASDTVSLRLNRIPFSDESSLKKSISAAVNQLNTDKLLSLFSKKSKLCFRTVYSILQENIPQLANAPDVDFNYIEAQFRAAFPEEDEDKRNDWKLEDIESVIFSLFDPHIKIEQPRINNFLSLYQRCFLKYTEEHSNYKEYMPQALSYQLFIFQTFLYLATLQLHLTDKKQAKRFLDHIQDPRKLSELLTQLTRSHSIPSIAELPISPGQWQSILDATYEIAISYIDAPHYDELRTACSAVQLKNTHYLVMGGKLCWSTSPLTESGNINTPAQASEISANNFGLFYDKRRHYITEYDHLSLIYQILNSDSGEALLWEVIEEHLAQITPHKASDILTRLINDKKYHCAELLISRIPFSISSFNSAFLQKPCNLNLIKTFLQTNDPYLHLSAEKIFLFAVKKGEAELVKQLLRWKKDLRKYFSGPLFLDAARAGHTGMIKLILLYRPDLLEYKGAFQHTAFLNACAHGHPTMAKFLMDMGANIHAKSVLKSDNPHYSRMHGKTARQWAETLLNTDKDVSAKSIIKLFDDYYQQLEINFNSDKNYKYRFTQTHIAQALDNNDLRLAELILKNRPDLINKLDKNDSKSLNKLQAQEVDLKRQEKERKEQERQRREEEHRQQERERQRQEEERRQQEEQRQRQEQERLQQEQQRQRQEQQRQAEARRQREQRSRAQRQHSLRELLKEPMAVFDKQINLFETRIKQSTTRKNPAYHDTVSNLVLELKTAKDEFLNHINKASQAAFIGRCRLAMDGAKTELAKHRGWYAFNAAMRKILGILAAITVVPALITHQRSEQGYYGTFFGKKDLIDTQSVKELNSLRAGLELTHLRCTPFIR